MNRTGVIERQRFVALIVTAIAGSAAQAQVAPELGGADGAAFLEAAEAERRQQREENRP